MRPPTIFGAAVWCATFAAIATRAEANRLTSSDVPFVDAQMGVAYANMLAFSNHGLFPGVNESRVWGSHLGATVGLRFGPIAFGLHGDLSRFSPYDIGTIGGVVELRLPIPAVQPWARLGFGYAWLGDVNISSSLARCSPTSTSTQCPTVRGWNLNGGAGVDFWITRVVTVGAGLDLYVLNLTRSASPTIVNFERDGDAVGLQASVTAQLGLHF